MGLWVLQVLIWVDLVYNISCPPQICLFQSYVALTCLLYINKLVHTNVYSLCKSFVFWFILGDLKREHFLSLVRLTPVVVQWNPTHVVKMSDPSREKQTNALDQFLKFGRFQAISAWVISSLLGFFSAFSNGHLMFILFDPPQGGWWCEDGGVPLCDDSAEGCESDV